MNLDLGVQFFPLGKFYSKSGVDFPLVAMSREVGYTPIDLTSIKLLGDGLIAFIVGTLVCIFLSKGEMANY